MKFAECSPDQLDEFEVAIIQLAQKTRPLRNKLITSRPGGERDLTVTVRAGQSLTLPWERQRRGPIKDHPGFLQATDQKHASFEKLRAIVNFGTVTALVAIVGGEVTPSHAISQSVLWTVSALPLTNKAMGWRRLITLSAGRVEILRTFEDTTGETARNPSFLNLNLAPDTDMKGVAKTLRRRGLGIDWIRDVDYAAFRGMRAIEIPELAQTEALLLIRSLLIPSIAWS